MFLVICYPVSLTCFSSVSAGCGSPTTVSHPTLASDDCFSHKCLDRSLFFFIAEMKTPKRRQPFVPFALRNHTGCTLWFATLTTTPTR